MRNKDMPGHQITSLSVPHVGNRKSFKKAEAEARKVLKEKGLTDAEIEAELKRAKRLDH